MTAIPPLVAAVVAAFPMTYVPVTATHDEFIAWARTQDGVDTRIVDFLANRIDCAGSTPADWMRLARMGMTPWFATLPGFQRTSITVGVVGKEPANAFMDWAVTRSMPQLPRAARRALRAA